MSSVEFIDGVSFDEIKDFYKKYEDIDHIIKYSHAFIENTAKIIDLTYYNNIRIDNKKKFYELKNIEYVKKFTYNKLVKKLYQ